jgi:hypothetical protein
MSSSSGDGKSVGELSGPRLCGICSDRSVLISALVVLESLDFTDPRVVFKY